MATFKSIEKKPVEYNVRANDMPIVDGKKIWDIFCKGVSVFVGIAAKDEKEALETVISNKKFTEVTKQKMNLCWELWRNYELIANGKADTEIEAKEFAKTGELMVNDLLIIHDNKNSNKSIEEFGITEAGVFKKLVIEKSFYSRTTTFGGL
jgi:hypothetical protein